MFKEYKMRCELTRAHPVHSWYSGFFNKATCDGKFRVKPSAIELPKRELEYCHHRLQLTEWSWNTRYRIYKSSPDATLGFSCKNNCKDASGYLYKIELKRWQYNELVLGPSKADQTWPG